MNSREILFIKGHAISPEEISKRIVEFGNGYSDATEKIINESKDLDNDGKAFIKCASHILSNFGMTRSGPFHENKNERLRKCWNAVGASLTIINNSVRKSRLSRDRYILELKAPERENLIEEIWQITKILLPFTMGETSYGLVGASKILFSVLPEIVLPIDNAEWLHVFRTVDIGDVLRSMVVDIQKWEETTGRQLNKLDRSERLTTIPAVYNVMAMLARPKPNKNENSENQ